MLVPLLLEPNGLLGSTCVCRVFSRKVRTLKAGRSPQRQLQRQLRELRHDVQEGGAMHVDGHERRRLRVLPQRVPVCCWACLYI